MNAAQEESGLADSGKRGTVKVIDRRWFTAEGEPRESVPGHAAAPPAEEPPAPAAASAPAAPAPAARAAVPEPSGTAPQEAEIPASTAAAPPERGDTGALPTGPGLADIVDLLAQQAMAFMSGQVPGRGRDPATARYFIDLLGVLKEKTAGRLTLEETNFLDDVLYQLRSLFVAATR
jgi:hypothetical protein